MNTEGFSYVVDLGDGVVKIGRTNQRPETRMAAYKKEGYIKGNHYVTEYRLVDAVTGEEKVRLSLDKHLSRGREYFSCSFEHAVSIVKNVYTKAEKYMEPIGDRNAISMQFKEPEAELYRWLIQQATKNRRSASAQVKFYLEQIKDGKIKVEGMGG